MTHLPAAESKPAQLHRLNAWLAAKRGDVDTERRELERLLAADPADLTALDRLAQLAEKDGQPARAAELRRKKAEIDRLRARYVKLHERKQPIRDAVEMARLAEQLGRGFEARGFLTMAVSDDLNREDLRHESEWLGQRFADDVELAGKPCPRFWFMTSAMTETSACHLLVDQSTPLLLGAASGRTWRGVSMLPSNGRWARLRRYATADPARHGLIPLSGSVALHGRIRRRPESNAAERGI